MTDNGSFGTPAYRPGRGGSFKALRNVEEIEPRTGAILGVAPESLMTAIAAACQAGCAVMFSPTSDGGAISVTLYAGEQRHRAYAATADEFLATLMAVGDVSEAHMLGGTTKGANGPLRKS